MLNELSSKRAASLAARSCKVCGNGSVYYGAVDFSKSCMEKDGIVFPPLGKPVPYWRCETCGFVFTDYCDAWTKDDFATQIYNDRYIEVDPDFIEKRAKSNADALLHVFGGRGKGLKFLDYGSGSSRLSALLNEQGMSAESYDPFFGKNERPNRTFDVITCYEVMEHTPAPHETVRDMLSFLKDDGIVLFSTLLITPEIAKEGLSWWYIGPRNGHISIYTPEALKALFAQAGFNLMSFDQNQHMAFKTLDKFTQVLGGGAG